MANAVVPVRERAVFIVPDADVQIDVRIESENVWLTQQQLADLFDVSVPAVNEHIGNIYDQRELDRGATLRKFRIVRKEARPADCRKRPKT